MSTTMTEADLLGDYFNGQMEPEERFAVAELLTLSPKPTGSRLFCPSTVVDPDFDLFCRGCRVDAINLISAGWEPGTSLTDEFLEGGQEHLRFASLRRGRVNAIVIFEDDLYDKFRVATDLCCMLGGPTNRPQRIAVFRAVLYGKSPNS